MTQHAPAHPIARFQDAHRSAALKQRPRRHQPREPRADHDHVDRLLCAGNTRAFGSVKISHRSSHRTRWLVFAKGPLCSRAERRENREGSHRPCKKNFALPC